MEPPLFNRKESIALNLSAIDKSLFRPESSASLDASRKCETATGSSTSALEGRAVDRSRVCSRCSSLLSLASSSRYSLAAGHFVPAPNSERLFCKLCLTETGPTDAFKMDGCGCSYCRECMKAYAEFEIEEGAYEIGCPDARCQEDAVLSSKEISSLVGPELVEKHERIRINRDVAMDRSHAWCPRAGCETICSIGSGPVRCPNCSNEFCSVCRESWHSGPCDDLTPGVPFDGDGIKCCPVCFVPIERDEGCAEMTCKRCKHLFCWYCLALLDDDLLLRHYDKGPCKNKLGHSRAYVIWYRARVIGIFAGCALFVLLYKMCEASIFEGVRHIFKGN